MNRRRFQIAFTGLLMSSALARVLAALMLIAVLWLAVALALSPEA